MSRGCPWKCDFCYNSSPNLPKKYRVKPVENIVSEINSLGVNHIMFIDDNFIGDPKYAKMLSREFKKLNITWHTAVSVDIGKHDDILDNMAESGCKSLFIGFETVNQKNLKHCGKFQNKVKEYDRTIEKIHQRGMMINASVAFGFDSDDINVFSETVNWLSERKIASMTAHILTPYPGTTLYEKYEKEGRIIDNNLNNYNTANVVYKPKLMTPEELYEGYLWSYEEFYSWKRIYQRIPVNHSQKVAFFAFNILYRKYGKYVSLLGKMGLMQMIGKLGKMVSYRENKIVKDASKTFDSIRGIITAR